MTSAPPTISAVDMPGLHRASRLVLTSDIITASWPRRGALDAVLPWADLLEVRLRELFGYQLIATASHVRLIRSLDTLDGSQREPFMTTGSTPKEFDQRRLAYLCLVLSIFQRSRTEIDLVDLVAAFTPLAHQIEGLGYDGTISTHKRAVADVIEWLIARGALRVSEGSVDSWITGDREADALFDVDHDICSQLFRPHKPMLFIDSIDALLENTTAGPGQHHAEALRQKVRRLLVELPVVYYAQVEPAIAELLQSRDLAEEVCDLTGLLPEYAAEGVMLTDPSGYFTDERFPNRPSATNRAAGLLASVAVQQISENSSEYTWLPVTTLADDNADRTSLADNSLGTLKGRQSQPTAPSTLLAPFVSATQLSTTLTGLYTEFGPASFGKWSGNPQGLLRNVIPRLCELGLAQQVPGGILLLPLAARFRKIIEVVRGHRSQQTALDFAGKDTDE